MKVTDIQTFLDYYAKVRARTLKMVVLIPPDHIDWKYRQDKFSIGDMVRHIAAIERYLYAEVVQGNKSRYTGCGKELAASYDEVVHFITTLHEESTNIFKGISNDALPNKCCMPGGHSISVASALRAMTEHEIHHRGQLYMYLEMLGVRTPPIFGMTSEDVINRA